MHPTATITITAVLMCLAAHAQAINKCTAPDGKTVFQDAPCATGQGGKIDIKPASGPARPTAAPAAANPSTRGQTEAQRLEAMAGTLHKENRLSTLLARAIPDAQHRIDQQRTRCDRELAALQAKKPLARNNLAGATWEQSISAEMSAVALRCDTEHRSLMHTLDTLQKEREEIRAAIGK